MIEHLQPVNAKMKREMFGPRSDRSQRLIDQMELQLQELASGLAAATAAAGIAVQGFTRRKATRRTFPMACRAGASFDACLVPMLRGDRQSKNGRVSPDLDVVPQQWFMTEHAQANRAMLCERLAIRMEGVCASCLRQLPLRHAAPVSELVS